MLLFKAIKNECTLGDVVSSNRAVPRLVLGSGPAGGFQRAVMFNFVVFGVYLVLVFQGAGLAVLWGYASSCSISYLAQLVDTGCRGRSPDRSAIVQGRGALLVRVCAGGEVVRCSREVWVLWSFPFAPLVASLVRVGVLLGSSCFPLLFRFCLRASLGASNGVDLLGYE